MVNTGAYEKWAVVCPSGYAMVSRAVNNRGQDLFEGDITTGANTAVNQLNSTGNEQGTFLSSDCLRVYFQSDRSNNQFDIYMASRKSSMVVIPMSPSRDETATRISQARSGFSSYLLRRCCMVSWQRTRLSG